MHNLSPKQEEEVFAQWAYNTPEPTLQNPPDLEYERKAFYRLLRYIKSLSRSGKPYKTAVAKKIREYSACRLLRFDILPDDIILHIFRQGVFFSPENRHASCMPLLYSKVCQRWRNLTLEASWLWSFIIFPDNHAPYSLTRLYLERSRLAPLVIEINITNTEFDPNDDALWPAADHLQERMSLFLLHAHRWSSFTCYTDNWAPLSHVIDKMSTVELPLLKDLVLMQNFDDPDDHPSSTLLPLVAAPCLNQLRLIGLALDWKHLSELHLNLSDFVLHQLPELAPLPSVEDFYGIINASTNLRKLSLGGVSFLWDPVKSPPPRILQPIHLPYIEQVSFQAYPGDNGGLEYLAYLLMMLDFGPNLCSVSLSRYFEDPDVDRFVPVLASKFGRIEHLSIGDILMTSNQLVAWLNLLPNLTTLSILCEMIQPIIFGILSQKFDHLTTPILCPRLHTLCPHGPQDGLVPMVVTARLGMGKPLRHIVWDINDRDIVERSPHYRYLKRRVRMTYEGSIVDLDDMWVGPNGEYADIWNPHSYNLNFGGGEMWF